jgi:membrane protein involved in colicin uptake
MSTVAIIALFLGGFFLFVIMRGPSKSPSNTSGFSTNTAEAERQKQRDQAKQAAAATEAAAAAEAAQVAEAAKAAQVAEAAKAAQVAEAAKAAQVAEAAKVAAAAAPIQQNTIFDPDGELGWTGPNHPAPGPQFGHAPTQNKFDPDGELGW